MPASHAHGLPPHLQSLCDNGSFGQDASSLIHLETHISWLVLGETHAWKFKKPVNFGFLDFSTLAKRKHLCDEELRLNQRTAPELYLEVVSVNADGEAAVFSGTGPVLDYALKMRRFDQDGLLNRLSDAGSLNKDHMAALATAVADLHGISATASDELAYSTPSEIGKWFTENFTQILPHLEGAAIRTTLGTIEQWGSTALNALEPLMDARHARGYVREGHGDLHLGNIVLTRAGIRLFDCIEFNPALRWIDTASDIAFLIMDLEHRQQHRLATVFLNGYLHHTGDYEGLRLLNYYKVYRAMVRAKVALLRLQQCAEPDKAPIEHEFRAYVALATTYCKPTQATLVITHGLSGSGKSHYGRAICEAFGMIMVRSDVERKRLAGLSATASSASAIDGGLYDRNTTRATYQRLETIARLALASGLSLLVDATFLKRRQRARFIALAQQTRAHFAILSLAAPKAVLAARIRERSAHENDASEATLAVLEAQYRSHEPLSDDEVAFDIPIDTVATEPDDNALLKQLQSYLDN